MVARCSGSCTTTPGQSCVPRDYRMVSRNRDNKIIIYYDVIEGGVSDVGHPLLLLRALADHVLSAEGEGGPGL